MTEEDYESSKGHNKWNAVVAGSQQLPAGVLIWFVSRGQGNPSHDSKDERRARPWENPMVFFIGFKAIPILIVVGWY